MYKRIFFFTFKGLIIATYYGEIKLHFKVRMCEHLGVSARTGERVIGDNDSAITDDHLKSFIWFDNFSISTSNNSDFKIT